jgi:protein-S-isoprenylcysteine O-methyltransferase Ste14
LSILLLPATVTVLVPYLLASRASGPAWWPIEGSLTAAVFFAGCVLIVAGLALVAATIRWFATVGGGTLAPWDPTRRLVVTGVYRHVRNPMISGVLLILIGEALGLRSLPQLAWAGMFFLLNATYIPLIEERGLERRFGSDYRQYRRHVPRWLPRLTPWQPPSSASG